MKAVQNNERKLHCLADLVPLWSYRFFVCMWKIKLQETMHPFTWRFMTSNSKFCAPSHLTLSERVEMLMNWAKLGTDI